MLCFCQQSHSRSGNTHINWLMSMSMSWEFSSLRGISHFAFPAEAAVWVPHGNDHCQITSVHKQLVVFWSYFTISQVTRLITSKHPADDQWPVYCLNLPVYLEPSLIWNLSYNMGTVRSRCLWPRFLWLYLFSIWLSWAQSWVPTWWLLRSKILSKNQRVFTCSLHNRLHPPWFLMKSGDPEPFLTYAAIGSACWETSHDAMSAPSTMFM